mmetsp:Transcript_70063/g.81693  ORF Transcript_70063/g.81693 Transcript_70063/m.81693 type:complete len:292 (-) Transcript_70063:185-1060(-)
MKKILLFIIATVLFCASAYDFDSTCSESFPQIHDYTLLIELIKKHSLKNEPESKIKEILDAKQLTKSQLSNTLFKCLENLMRRGFFKASQVFIDEVIEPFDIDSVDFVKNIGNQIKKEIDVLTVSSRRNVQQAIPVFQWGQSNSTVLIQIKFAHRWDAPGCINIKDEVVKIESNSLYFSAFCVQANNPMKFVLNITLYDEIVPESSLWKLESVGRMHVELTKKYEKIWIRLPESTETISQLQVWWDLRDKYADSMDEYSRMLDELEDKMIEEKNKKKKEKKSKKNKKGDEL